MINVTVTAWNSKGESSSPRGYLLTVVERRTGGGGGGCQNSFFFDLGGIAGFVGTMAGLMLKRRSRATPEPETGK
jgi:hypothetical protein